MVSVRDPNLRGLVDLPKDDDLVLRDLDGKYYWIKKDEYQKFDVTKQVSSEEGRKKMMSQLEGLRRHGVLVADIPSTSTSGIGCSCYLIDLGAIRAAPKPQRTNSSDRDTE